MNGRDPLNKTFHRALLEKVLINLSMIEMTLSFGLPFPRLRSVNNLWHSQKILHKNTWYLQNRNWVEDITGLCLAFGSERERVSLTMSKTKYIVNSEAAVLRGFCQDPNSDHSYPAASPNEA
ncbi:hypothetical protein IGI04_025331 [Brassica rapa subsp. trilocularis]|uniref:Uncharacterized protein n=2 Tax=Brassica campestris TaxID=3711 RepID=M4EXS5_BRACM|nr:hypothetical protein IGI04_025331 [Brassica rapa subsp. trilocularis]